MKSVRLHRLQRFARHAARKRQRQTRTTLSQHDERSQNSVGNQQSVGTQSVELSSTAQASTSLANVDLDHECDIGDVDLETPQDVHLEPNAQIPAPATPVTPPTPDFPWIPQTMTEQKLPCGLLESQVSELFDREITPDDYDMLLQLDETIAKHTASKASLATLMSVPAASCLGEYCTICLGKFQKGDDVTALSCDHPFHSSCVLKWLSEHSRRCPVCGHETEANHERPVQPSLTNIVSP